MKDSSVDHLLRRTVSRDAVLADLKHKISKSAAGYVYRPEAKGRYQCDQCARFIPGRERCEVFGPGDKVRSFGSSNEWVLGTPSNELVPLGTTTPQKAVYMENRPGFGCKRCANFDAEGLDCRRVDKDSPGATPGKIIGEACCNEWAKA